MATTGFPSFYFIYEAKEKFRFILKWEMKSIESTEMTNEFCIWWECWLSILKMKSKKIYPWTMNMEYSHSHSHTQNIRIHWMKDLSFVILNLYNLSKVVFIIIRIFLFHFSCLLFSPFFDIHFIPCFPFWWLFSSK